jgi:primosomal protein N' (replication factor Y)
VFAPLENLGLIVVDEEHESSYKQFEPAPRYHARDTAILRASLSGATCVLGSATPALETYHNAQTGKYAYLRMTGRAPLAGGGEAQLPEVHVLDLTRETKRHQVDGALSRRLVEAIATRVTQREQVILLQNRRGYAPILECEDCGWSPFCRDCSVPMPYHKRGNQHRCHYCGRSARRPRACPQCSSQRLELIGTGTQRVEEQLAEQLSHVRVLRMDQDSTSRKGGHQKLLDAFGKGEADVLLGTQMVAKGLDFARVTLVGVISADTGLLLPDFRAEERAFQLMTQVAGRAGRAELVGDVLIQTRRPDQAALAFAKSHDYEGFARHALAEREALGYPPFGRIVGLEFKGPDEQTTKRLAEEWTACFRDVAGEAFQVLGPEPALIARVKRFYRFTSLVKVSLSAPPVQPVLRRTIDAFGSLPAKTRVNIDVDAQALL